MAARRYIAIAALEAANRGEFIMTTTRVLGMTLLVGSLLAGPAFGQALSQSEVETVLRGKTFTTADFGGTGTISWSADGVISVDVTRPDGSKVVDTGTYRFGEGGYCSTWSRIRTTEACFTLRRTGATTFDILNRDGSLDSQLTAR
jgi:hypothetical protein